MAVLVVTLYPSPLRMVILYLIPHVLGTGASVQLLEVVIASIHVIATSVVREDRHG